MNVVTKSEAVTASITLALALTGNRLHTASTRLTRLSNRFKARASTSRLLMPGIVAAALLVVSIHPAAAQTAGGAGNLTTFLTNMVNLITGQTGQIIAVIAVALAGIATMFSAISIRAFGSVVLGCAILFSAAWVVQQITGAAA